MHANLVLLAILPPGATGAIGRATLATVGFYDGGVKVTLGTALRTARNAKKLSQDWVARTCGIDKTYLSKIERDRIACPSYDTLEKLAVAMGCPQKQFVAWRSDCPRCKDYKKVADDLYLALSWLKQLTFEGEGDNDTRVWPEDATQAMINDALTAYQENEKR